MNTARPGCIERDTHIRAFGAIVVVVTRDVVLTGHTRALEMIARGGPLLPILSTTDQILGAFSLNLRERRAPTPDERELVERLAFIAAIAIERQQASEIAREADRRKDEFLAMLAHELRNPLAPIHTAAQLLAFADRDTTIPSRARLVIERQVQNMTRLIDDLLDVSRITRGMVELHKTPIDIAQLVARAVETAAPHLQKRGHRLTVSMPGGPMLVS